MLGNKLPRNDHANVSILRAFWLLLSLYIYWVRMLLDINESFNLVMLKGIEECCAHPLEMCGLVELGIKKPIMRLTCKYIACNISEHQTGV